MPGTLRNEVFNQMLVNQLVKGMRSKERCFRTDVNGPAETISIAMDDTGQFTLATHRADITQEHTYANLQEAFDHALVFIGYEQRGSSKQQDVFNTVFAQDLQAKQAEFDHRFADLAFGRVLSQAISQQLERAGEFDAGVNGESYRLTVRPTLAGGYRCELFRPDSTSPEGFRSEQREAASISDVVEVATPFINYGGSPEFARDVIAQSIFRGELEGQLAALHKLVGKEPAAVGPKVSELQVHSVTTDHNQVHAMATLETGQNVLVDIGLSGHMSGIVELKKLNELGWISNDKMAVDLPQLQKLMDNVLYQMDLSPAYALSAHVPRGNADHGPAYSFTYAALPELKQAPQNTSSASSGMRMG